MRTKIKTERFSSADHRRHCSVVPVPGRRVWFAVVRQIGGSYAAYSPDAPLATVVPLCDTIDLAAGTSPLWYRHARALQLARRYCKIRSALAAAKG